MTTSKVRRRVARALSSFGGLQGCRTGATPASSRRGRAVSFPGEARIRRSASRWNSMVIAAQPNRGSPHLLLLLPLLPWRSTLLFLPLLPCSAGHRRHRSGAYCGSGGGRELDGGPQPPPTPNALFIGLFWRLQKGNPAAADYSPSSASLLPSDKREPTAVADVRRDAHQPLEAAVFCERVFSLSFLH
jgi:hypothetical protein